MLQLNEEKSKDKINELILKTKADMKGRPHNVNTHPWIMLSFN